DVHSGRTLKRAALRAPTGSRRSRDVSVPIGGPGPCRVGPCGGSGGQRMDQLLSFPARAQGLRGYRITVLGPFSLSRGRNPLDTSAWRPRALSLLRLLAVTPELRRPREEVIDLLWPDSSPESGSANLRDLVRIVRKTLQEDTPLVLLEQ